MSTSSTGGPAGASTPTRIVIGILLALPLVFGLWVPMYNKLTPEFERMVTLLLAITIAYENRPDEARALGAPYCGDARDDDALFERLKEQGICQ